MTRPRAGAAPALALLTLVGCGNLQVQEGGAVDPGRQPLPGGLPMSFDRLGDATIALRRVDLPKRREVERFGITVVDVTSLHRLVPAHLREHKLVVSSLERASPFAAAGLRPFDAVTALDGRPVESLDDLVSRLGAKEPGEAARLAVVRPGGEAAEVTAEASGRVLASGGFRVPLLVERQSSGSGHALGLGPLDALFYYRSALEHWAVRPGAPDPAASPFPPIDQELAVGSRSRFGRRFEWGALLNMFLWESDVDLQTGEERGRFRLFWVLSFGDDLTPRGGGA
ncbi:MAG: PDZ domain-containing protein [Planctomycetes bacterium]|nr:PDZ domain-containing protein [Planctomycetota bacterium]